MHTAGHPAQVDVVLCRVLSDISASGVSLGAPLYGDNCAGARVEHDAPDIFALGVTVVTWRVTDGSGNTAAAAQLVRVEDRQNPVITAPGDVVVGTDLDECAASGVELGAPLYGDNCAGGRVEQEAPEIFRLGVTVVTWRVTDGSGNTATAAQLVTVEDRQNPVITAPADLVVSADLDECGASGVALGAPLYGDNCAGARVEHDAPDIFPLGVTVVTWRVTDGSGNTATSAQLVRVEDRQNPVITAPADVVVSADLDECAASGVALGAPLYGDNCAGARVEHDGPDIFALGVTVVTWRVTDGSGNNATAAQ
jgi:glutaredoxin